MDIIDVINGCKSNDRSAQTALYNTYKNTLYSLCLKYCRNQKDAEDVLHESFINIFKNIHNYKAKGSFEGWMKRITINKAIDKYHKGKINFLELVEDKVNDDTIEEDLSSYSLDYLLQLIQDLPDKYRLVFNLYVLDGFKHKEIASMLGINIGTSKSNLSRAKRILKNKIIGSNTAKKLC